jgi:arylsulfatase A-like enzyme
VTDHLPLNIAVIMSDEQRWDTLGVTGNPAARTPHLDALATRGTVMDRCYAAYPLCCPSRMSLWTGLMAHDHHGFGNWRALRPDLRDGGLVRPFTAAGYHTIYTGKWHVPGTTPERFGFTDASAIPAVIDGQDRGRYIADYRAYATAQGYELVPGNIENLTAADIAALHQPGKAPCGRSEIPLAHYLETWQTGEFLAALDRRPATQPFFAVCSYNAPHFPMIVPAPFDELIDPEDIALPANFATQCRGKPAEVMASPFAHDDLSEAEWRRLIAHYLGFCALIDAQVGRIVEHLAASGDLDRTIVVFVSDHGDMMGSHGLIKKGFPLLYEETLHVPLILSGPGIPAGHRAGGLVSLIDLVPTLADLTGVTGLPCTSGQSFAAAFRAPAHWQGRPWVVAESYRTGSEESGKGGEHLTPADFDLSRDSVNLSIRTREHRYTFRWADRDEFYDLHDDPGEMVNLAGHPEMDRVTRPLRRELARSIERAFPEVANRLLS